MRRESPARKDFTVSNSASSPVVLRIQQSALVFVVLLLVLGALILAANNIDPNAAVRGDVRYTLWTSPDGLFSLEYPAGWTPQPVNSPLRYVITSPDQAAVGTLSFISTTASTDAVKDPQSLVEEVTASLVNGGTSSARTLVVDGVRSAMSIFEVSQADPSTGATQTQNGEIWIVPLDNTHFLLTNIVVPGEAMATIKPAWEHMMNSIHINKPTAYKALGIGVPTATPTTVPTQAATAGATEQATENATSVATSAATAAATAAP
jgi:hypothetical protein